MSSAPRVYACFDASRSKNPARSDLRYYFLLRAWLHRGPLQQAFVDVHGLARPGKPADLAGELARRLRQSDVMLLILTPASARSAGWMPWEIEFASAECALPLLCTYPGCAGIDVEQGHPPWWPAALQRVVQDAAVPVRHARFQAHAVAQGLRHACA